MNDSLSMILAAIFVSVTASAAVTYLVRRTDRRDGNPDIERLHRLEDDLAALRETKSDIEKRLAVEEQKASRISGLEAALIDKNSAIDSLRDGKASVERSHAASSEAVAQLTSKLSQSENSRAALVEQLEKSKGETVELRTRLAKLQESLDQEVRQSEAKLNLLKDAKERMSQEFKSLAEEVMRAHGETFSKQNKEQIDTLLGPLRQRLVDFQQGLQTAQTESARERATLAEQIRKLSEDSAKMTLETHNLTQALKGKAQTQGAWGEMILTTILERSGLRPGEEYVTQASHSTEDGNRLRPDVIVNLPGGQRVIIDAKVSLTAFESYVNGESEVERTAQRAKHVQSIRAHIKALSGKEYQQSIDTGLDYVIMFIPIEGALAVAVQEDPAITGYAAELNVTIASPTTLMIALRTIANVWQVERRNRNADAIAERAGRLYDKFVGFIEDMRLLGNRLNGTQKLYADAMGKLSDGPGNVVRQVEMLKDLGAKAAKTLPASLIGDDEIESLPAPIDAGPGGA